MNFEKHRNVSRGLNLPILQKPYFKPFTYFLILLWNLQLQSDISYLHLRTNNVMVKLIQCNRTLPYYNHNSRSGIRVESTWLTDTMSRRTPIARFLTEMTASAMRSVEMTPSVNITGRKMNDRRFSALWPNVRPSTTSATKNIVLIYLGTLLYKLTRMSSINIFNVYSV